MLVKNEESSEWIESSGDKSRKLSKSSIHRQARNKIFSHSNCKIICMQ
jgi:hypothetical protein